MTRAIFVTVDGPSMDPSVTVALVCTECDGRPARAKISESAMEKQDA